MAKQQCSNCRYFKKRAKGHIEFAHSAGNTFVDIKGFCVRYPPVLISFDERMGSYPGVTNKDKCGEYAPANPESVSDAAVTIARLVLLGDLSSTWTD